MALFLLKRLALLPVIMLGVVTLVFFLIHAVPGSPIHLLIGPDAGKAELEKAIKDFGLDKPVVYQYVLYVKKIFTGDLGRSIYTGRSVMQDIETYLPATLELTFVSLVFIIITGVLFGVLSAVRPNSAIDTISRGIAIGGGSLPQFWWGLILILVFYYYLPWFPGGGRIDPFVPAPPRISGMLLLDSFIAGNWAAFKSSLLHIILPAFTLSLTNLSTLTRVTRSAMMRELKKDYITMVRAYGVREIRINFIFAFKNVLVAVVSVLGLSMGFLLGGAFLVETVFDWPGLGLYATSSIVNVDFEPVVAVALLVSFIYVVLNLLTDLVYALVDPRIRYWERE